MASKQYDQAPAQVIDSKKSYLARLETSRGTIELELYPGYAPKTVNNFDLVPSEPESCEQSIPAKQNLTPAT